MRIMELDRLDLAKLPTKVMVELARQPDGSVRATWHDDVFREYIEQRPPAVWIDGELVEVNTPELLFRHGPEIYRRSQVYAVLEP